MADKGRGDLQETEDKRECVRISAAKKVPGSQGEHDLQDQFGTQKRAYGFYSNQMLNHLNEEMCVYIARQEMVFVATADMNGECDGSLRCGNPGFVRVLDNKHLIYPEYRGNGVMASLGNILTNGHIGMFFVDFFSSTVGLHVNGNASITENEKLLERDNLSREIRGDLNIGGGRRPERWVEVEVEEAYIHCSKHIPLLQKLEKSVDWGTDDEVKKGGDFFKARKTYSPWKDMTCSTEGDG